VICTAAVDLVLVVLSLTTNRLMLASGPVTQTQGPCGGGGGGLYSAPDLTE